MLTDSTSKPMQNIGFVGLNQVRHNWKRWAGPKTRAWLDLGDGAFIQRLEAISHLKRFLEQYCVDPAFRANLLANPAQAIAHHSLKINLEDVRSLWDESLSLSAIENLPLSESVQYFLEFSQEWMDWAELRQIGDRSQHSWYKAWRERQIARTQFQFSEALSQGIAHVPVCFELSQGCSVGCYFCGISAPKLEDIFTYTPENAQLWREILELLQETLGESVSAGFCYWATDPLDNPDYEQFMLDFYNILGVFPQTTTAQPTKDLNRVRSLLKLSFEKGCKLNRFSILSPKILDQVYDEFTAYELAFVGVVPQNREAQILTHFPFIPTPAKKMNAGRLLQRQQAPVFNQDFVDGTIACVSGFLINLVERSIKLISPCVATSQHPLGYITFAQGSFTDIHSFRSLLSELIAQNMSPSIPASQQIRFRQDIQYQPLFDGFQLSTAWKTITVRHLLAVSGTLNYAQFGKVIHNGEHTADEIVRLFANQNISADTTLKSLNHLYDQGVLQEPINT